MKSSPLKTLRAPLRQCRNTFIVACAAATVTQAVGIPLALLTRRIVNTAAESEQGSAPDELWILGGTLIGLALLRGIARWIQRAMAERGAQSVIAHIRRQMYDHLLTLPLSYFDRRAVGKILVRFVGDAAGLKSWLTRFLVSAPADVITLLGIAITRNRVSHPPSGAPCGCGDSPAPDHPCRCGAEPAIASAHP